MRAESEDWQSELWSFVNAGDGKNCPGFDSCLSQRDGLGCFNNAEQRAKNRSIHLFVDRDDLDFSLATTFPRLNSCPQRGRMTALVRKLAQKYYEERWDGNLPVPDNLITTSPDGIPIDVRHVPLKANHGAVWRMDDGWVIYLNSDSSPARQRFTLYHEIFHIMAHSNGNASFKHSDDDEIYFNEFLADHFAGAILTPLDVVRKKWSEVKDVLKMAQLFNIPAPIIYGKLRAMGINLTTV